MQHTFHNRSDAGRQLARALASHSHRTDVVVLALPRGGVPVAYEVARGLHAPLDVCVVRKLGVPSQSELAFGAIASGGVRVLNDDIVSSLNLSSEVMDAVTRRETKELSRREIAYRSGRPPILLEGKTVILVDDGIATGSTMLAAIQAIRKQRPQQVIVAVPTAAQDSCARVERQVDQMVCLIKPQNFYAVAQWYSDFSQTTDEEVIRLLKESCRERALVS